MQMVKETLNDGYCDISGSIGDLTRQGESGALYATPITANGVQGEMGNVRLYFSKGMVIGMCLMGHDLTNFNADILNPSEVLNAKKNVIARFIHVVVPIRDLYQLPPTSVHIFCDSAGSTIAFNRDASIFLNLRYYEAWRMSHLLCPCHLRSPG